MISLLSSWGRKVIFSSNINFAPQLLCQWVIVPPIKYGQIFADDISRSVRFRSVTAIGKLKKASESDILGRLSDLCDLKSQCVWLTWDKNIESNQNLDGQNNNLFCPLGAEGRAWHEWVWNFQLSSVHKIRPFALLKQMQYLSDA